MRDPRKSDKDAKEAYIKKLQSEGYSNIKIISTPADIIASKNGLDFYFEIKKTEKKDIYFGAATLTEWLAAMDPPSAGYYFFVVAIKLKENKWKFEEYTPRQFMKYSTIPPFKLYFNVPISNTEKSKVRKNKTAKKLTRKNLVRLYNAFEELD